MLTVQDLVDVPHLHLSLLAGHSGLSREVTWVHISDLQDPWKWLASGDLLLTNGLGLPRAEADQAAFLERLDEIGVSGVAVGADMPAPAVPLTTGASTVADRLGLPLLEVPYAIPFSAIQQFAATSRSKDESTSVRLRTVSQTYDILRGGLAAGHSKADIMGHLADCLSCHLYLVDTKLKRPLLTSPAAPNRAADVLGMTSSELLPGIMRLPGAGVHSLVVPVPSEPGLALLVEPHQSSTPELEVLHHVATIMGVLVAELRGEWRRKRRAAESLLTRLLRGEVDTDSASTAMARFGISKAHTVTVAARSSAVEQDAEEVFRWLSILEVPALITATDDYLLLLLPDRPEDLRHTVDLLSSQHFSLGVSEATAAVAEIPVAARQALWALAAAGGPAETVRFSDDGILLPRTFDEAEVIVDRLLGALIAYDRQRSTALVATLRAYLQHDGSWAATARHLAVHKQSLGYRIKRIEDVTGRSLKSISDTSQLWFALRAHDYMNAGTPASDRGRRQ